MVIETESEPSRDGAVKVFAHPRSIVRGKGRILYADAQRMPDGRVIPAGWVLPGGQRTQSEALAVVWADRLHAIFAKAAA